MTKHGGTRFIARQWQVWLLVFVSLAAAGCGRSGQITGKVRYKGKELPTGRVVFFNEKDRQVGSASINKDGTYSATVPSGTLRIAIITPAGSSLKSLSKAQSKPVVEGIKKMKPGFSPLEGEGAENIPEKVVTVPGQYAEPSTSGLTLEVLGGPQSYDIELQ